MMGRSVPIVASLLLLVSATLVSPPSSAAADDMNLTGSVYLDNGTSLSNTLWTDNTSFAVYVNHMNDWSTAWRYPPSPQWYATSMGAYSIVLPASEKDKNWSDGDSYRVGFDVSSIIGVPGRTENATSHGTGDPGEITPLGASENAIVWNSTDNWQRWDVVLLSLPDLAVLPGDVTATPDTVQTGEAVALSATVWDLGNRSADSFLSLFFDANANRFPDPGEVFDVQPVSLLPAENATFVRAWFAAGVGTHSFCAYADPGNLVQETDEGNNVECASVLVEPPPATRPDHVPVQANPPSPVKTGLSQSVPLSVRVFNGGNGTATTNSTLSFYNQSSPPFKELAVGLLAPGATSQVFTATWTSPATPGARTVSVDVDYYNNVTEWDETNNVYTWTVEVVTGPVTSLTIGSPNYTSTATYVRSDTPLSLSVLDQSGSGIKHTKYRIDNGTWTDYSLAFFLPGSGIHYIEWYSEDNLGNAEEVSWRVLIVDDSPPATAISIGTPSYTVGGSFLKSTTPLALAATDGGVGPNSTFYRLWNDSWSSWREYSSPFTLAGRDGTWHVEYLSFDHLGNAEAIKNETLVLDDTAPDTTLSPATGPYAIDTTFTLTATDPGCGVSVTMYRIDGGNWSVYSGGFALAEGNHNVSYYSYDHLNNTEAVRWRELSVQGVTQPPPPSVEANYKPLIALIFAIVLAIVGYWSSKKRPWKGGKDRMAVVKAFVIAALPFSLAEAATGIVSFFVGDLRIPPLIGAGTVVDLAILLAGIAVAFIRVSRKVSPESVEVQVSENQ